ncbi:MAG: acyl-CoA thioesterase [Hyphococcus sp.]
MGGFRRKRLYKHKIGRQQERVTHKTDFTFFHPLRVRWAECDAQGIVFNVNYFLYFDVAMTEWMRALGVSFSGDNAIEFLTARAEANYRAPAVFDDMLDIGARCARIGNKSMTVELAIFRGDELLNEGAMTYVHVDQGTKETSPIPEDFIARVVALEKTPPARGAA